MNPKSLAQTSLALLGLTVALTAGCRKPGPTTIVSASLVSDSVVSDPPVISTPTPPKIEGTASPLSDAEIASTLWADVKDVTFDNRAQFFTGLQKLEARVDQQIQELKAKRASMNSTVDTKNWDFAMKEMGNARAYLKSTGDELRQANPETWNQLKDKVGVAWVRTQEAYAKVKASTTI